MYLLSNIGKVVVLFKMGILAPQTHND